MKICLKIDGQEVCFWIPILIDRHYYDPNPPDPRLDLRRLREWVVLEGPHPEPWKADLPVLATINVLVAQLSDEGVRGQMAQAMQQATQEVARQLPKGLRVEMSEARAAAQ